MNTVTPSTLVDADLLEVGSRAACVQQIFVRREMVVFGRSAATFSLGLWLLMKVYLKSKYA